MDKTPSQLLNKILQNNQWFDIFRTKNDTKNMFRAMYNMRLFHGMLKVIEAELAHSIAQIAREGRSKVDHKFLQISTVASISLGCSKLITDSETILRNHLSGQHLEELANSFPLNLDHRGLEVSVDSVSQPADPAETEKTTKRAKSIYYPLPDADDLFGEKNVDRIDRALMKAAKPEGSDQTEDALACGDLREEQPTLVCFYTDWCIFSKKLMPVWERIRDSVCRKPINVVKIDCDGKKDFCRAFGIRSYPTIKLLMEGKIVDLPSNSNRSFESIASFVKEHTGVELV